VTEDRLDRIGARFPGGFDFRRHLLVAAIVGSMAHGTYVPQAVCLGVLG
jgi:hypothetical protein